MKKKYIALAIIILVQLAGGVYKVTRVPELYGYDGHYHMYLTERCIEEGKIPEYEINCLQKTKINYPTALYTAISSIHLISGINLLELFRYFGPILFSFLLLCLYMVLQEITKNEVSSLFGVITLGSNVWLLYRSYYGALPEAFALIFHVLSIYFLLKEKKLFFCVIVLAGAYFHLHTFFYIIIFFLAYYAIDITKINKISKKTAIKCLMVVSIALILLIPILGDIAIYYSKYLNVHVKGEVKLEYQPSPERYDPLNLSDFIDNIGVIPLILFPIGIYVLLKSKNKNKLKFLLLIWLLTTFIPTQSTRVGMCMISYRFGVYFSIPLVIVSSYGFNEIITKKYNLKSKLRYFTIIIIFFTISSFTYNTLSVRGFVGFQDTDFNAKKWLETNTDKDSIILTTSKLGVDFLPNFKKDCRIEIGAKILSMSSSDAIRKFVKREYKNRKVYFLLISSRKLDLDKRYPDRFELLSDFPLVFEEGDTRIYRLQ